MSTEWKEIDLMDNGNRMLFKDILYQYDYVPIVPFYYMEIGNHSYLWAKESNRDRYFHQPPKLTSGKWKSIEYDNLPKEVRKATIKDKI